MSYVIHFIFNQKNVYKMKSSCYNTTWTRHVSAQGMYILWYRIILSKIFGKWYLVKHLWPGIVVKGLLHLQLIEKKKNKGDLCIRNKISQRSSQNQTLIHVHRLTSSFMHIHPLPTKHLYIRYFHCENILGNSQDPFHIPCTRIPKVFQFLWWLFL